MFRIIEIYDTKCGWILTVTLGMGQHVIIRNQRQIRKFVVIHIKPEALFYLLFDEIVDDSE